MVLTVEWDGLSSRGGAEPRAPPATSKAQPQEHLYDKDLSGNGGFEMVPQAPSIPWQKSRGESPLRTGGGSRQGLMSINDEANLTPRAHRTYGSLV